MSAAPVAVGVGDVGELYGSLARRLEQIVRHDVHASEAVIEDACQTAWGRLVAHASRVSVEGALSWLATTAVREARKTARLGGRELSLDAEPDEGALIWSSASVRSTARRPDQASAPTPGPAELVEYRERLRALGVLPQRQRQMVWLHGAGFSYAEIAAATGCTLRTVERQLLRAKRALRDG